MSSIQPYHDRNKGTGNDCWSFLSMKSLGQSSDYFLKKCKAIDINNYKKTYIFLVSYNSYGYKDMGYYFHSILTGFNIITSTYAILLCHKTFFFINILYCTIHYFIYNIISTLSDHLPYFEPDKHLVKEVLLCIMNFICMVLWYSLH